MLKIINLIEEVKKAIPALEEIEDYGNTETISDQSWSSRMKTIETKNLKKYRKSTAWISLMMYFHSCVICVEGGKLLTINKAKYKLIREYVMSEEFNSTP
jgi:hypothetical protein